LILSERGSESATGVAGLNPGQPSSASTMMIDVKNDTENEQNKPQLPAIVDAVEALANPGPEPKILIEGLLHVGNKFVVGGCSKSYKTWTLIYLAICIAMGMPWWGMAVAQAKVLYINFEIQAYFFSKRIKAVCESLGVQLSPGQMDLLNLRGYATSFLLLLPQIAELIESGKYGLIVLDPLYKGLGSLNENDAGDMAQLMNEIERLAVQTGSAVVFGAHYSKGNQALKDPLDRLSGSGVFARDPDTILTLTKHEEDNAFTVDMVVRNFPKTEPFCVKWQYPMMRRDDALDPAKLKQIAGRKQEHTVEKIMDVLGAESLTTGEWAGRCLDEAGVSRSRFYGLRTQAEGEGKIKKTGNKWQASQKSQNSQNGNETSDSPKVP